MKASRGVAPSAVDGPIVRCKPSTLNAPVGRTVTISIFVQDVVDLYGADIQLQFNPTYAQVVDSAPTIPGVQITPLGGFLSPDFVVRREANNSTGLIRYAVTQVAPSQPVNGSGALARIDLQGTQAGEIAVPLVHYELVRRDGTAIPATPETCTWQFVPPGRLFLPWVLAW